MSDLSLIVCKYLPDSNEEIVRQVELTYNDAFPLVERRDFVDVLCLLRTEKRFNLELIMHSNKYVGFITWWDFDSFVYIEHFAIDEKHRNGGYGGKALSLFLQNLKQLVIKWYSCPVRAIMLKFWILQRCVKICVLYIKRFWQVRCLPLLL